TDNFAAVGQLGSSTQLPAGLFDGGDSSNFDANIYQRGSYNTSATGQLGVANRVDVDQIGNNNDNGGIGLGAGIVQIGYNQEAVLLQEGENLKSRIRQGTLSASSSNFATVSQTGEFNDSLIEQDGDDNRARVDQSGSDNYSSIFQNGMGNNADVAQGASGNESFVSQNGNGNAALVGQNAAVPTGTF
ncbi:MAG TPA: hypothetical protein DEP68_09105, partial [Erythrobacter sp.]|nr:hypothetical protein [Erythrobacter sp.]